MTKLTDKEIEKYIKNFTLKASPYCSECYELAEYDDSGAGEHYCYGCLVDSLNRDPEDVREMLNRTKYKQDEG